LVIVGFLTVVISEHVTIWITSFIGGYAIIRAISILAGDYPNEFTLADQINQGSYTFPWQFYLYMVGIIIAWILGCIV